MNFLDVLQIIGALALFEIGFRFHRWLKRKFPAVYDPNYVRREKQESSSPQLNDPDMVKSHREWLADNIKSKKQYEEWRDDAVNNGSNAKNYINLVAIMDESIERNKKGIVTWGGTV